MRKLIGLIPPLAALALSGNPAFAGAFDSGIDNPAVGSIAVSVGTDSPAPVEPATYKPETATSSPCLYTWIPGKDLTGPDGSTSGTWAYPFVTDPSYCRTGLQPGQSGPPIPFWVPASARQAPPAPQQVAEQALSSAQLAAPVFETWPPSGHGVVNWPTWVHVRSGWAPVSASATAGPETATVTAAPTAMTVSSVDSPDGGATYHAVSVSCPGPGTAYDPNQPYADQHSNCTISWAWPSANYGVGSSYGTYPLTVTVTYSVSWTATGGPGSGGTLAPITRSTTVDFRVGEVEALGS